MRVEMKRSDTALLIIDVQERLCAAMDMQRLDRVVARLNGLIDGAKALQLPLIVTEQYPKGLGPTLSSVKLKLGPFSPVEKLEFSATVPEVMRQLAGRKQILIAGMETHVCVFQTVRALADQGLQPLVCADAVLSRTDEDREIGLELCRGAGGVITTVEAALFDLLEGRAGGPEFKAVSTAIRVTGL